MNKILSILGFEDIKAFLLRYVIPIIVLDLLMLFAFNYFFEDFYLRLLGYFVCVSILFVSGYYPFMILGKQSKEIEQTLHFFITYAGALSTVNLERKEMFTDLSKKVRYLEIANAFKKLMYLVDNIKLDFSTASYKISNLYATPHFSRFLERMGIALSFNSSVSSFFLQEQVALMNSYAVVYKEGLERIKVLQDMFSSLIMAFSFVLATILLMPFLTGIDGTYFLKFGVLGVIVIDVMMVLFAKSFIPKDKLYQDIWDDGRIKIMYMFLIAITISLFLSPVVFIMDMKMSLKIAIICTPLLIVGIYSNYQEKLVWRRDILFPAFIRSLGNVHQSKGGTLTTTVETLLPHNFGMLNSMLERVYKRLKITKDKFNSWYFFSKESGSALISEFMDIFVTVVYRGGSAEVAGQIVSDNMSRINGLRDMKREYVSSLKGSLYGSFFSLALTVYISLLISGLLLSIFSSMTTDISGEAADMISGIFPMDMNSDMGGSTSYVAIIMAVHAFACGFMLKIVDGGNYFSLLRESVIMLWLGAILEIGIVYIFAQMFGTYL